MILVTGCSGFIGSNLVEELLRKKIDFIGLDIRPLPINLKDKFLFFQMNYNDVTSKFLNDNKIETVIHLAAKPGVRESISDPELYFTNNVTTFANFAEECIKSDIKRFIFASSSSVYGNTKGVEFKEEMLLRPISPYAATKVAGEAICSYIHTRKAIPTILLRFFTVYGPNNRRDMAVFKFLDSIIKEKVIELKGNATRDMTYVADAVRSITLSLDVTSGLHTVNISSKNGTSMINLIKTMEMLTGKVAKVMYDEDLAEGDMESTAASTCKAYKLFRFVPRSKLAEGLQKTYEWYQRENK